MSHAAFIALMHNQSLSINHTEMFESAEQITNNLILLLSDLIHMLVELLQYVAETYAATIANNPMQTFLIFCIVFYVAETIVDYTRRLKELENQNQYLLNKMKIHEGNMEFIYENHANNELKLQKLTKQIKKLQKEVNEYA